MAHTRYRRRRAALRSQSRSGAARFGKIAAGGARRQRFIHCSPACKRRSGAVNVRATVLACPRRPCVAATAGLAPGVLSPRRQPRDFRQCHGTLSPRPCIARRRVRGPQQGFARGRAAHARSAGERVFRDRCSRCEEKKRVHAAGGVATARSHDSGAVGVGGGECRRRNLPQASRTRVREACGVRIAPGGAAGGGRGRGRRGRCRRTFPGPRRGRSVSGRCA